MILTENIAQRLQEWLDRREQEPDLVPRLRRLWKEPAATRPAQTASARPARRLLRRVVLQVRPGM